MELEHRQVSPQDVVGYIATHVNPDRFVEMLQQANPGWLDGVVKQIVIDRLEERLLEQESRSLKSAQPDTKAKSA